MQVTLRRTKRPMPRDLPELDQPFAETVEQVRAALESLRR
jgi:hypothetical protein